MHFDNQYEKLKRDNGSSTTTDESKVGGGNSSWNTGTETSCADNCSYGDKSIGEPEIHIPYEILKVIGYLCTTVSVEWQMLLKGTEEIVDGITKVEITGYYIPKQEVSPSTVKNIDNISRTFLKEQGIVAGIHSHSDMGVFFSVVDEETNKSAIRHHIVVNNKLEFVARSRFKLPCGMEFFKDSKLNIDTPPVKVLDVEGIGNIENKGYGTAEDLSDTGWNTGTVNGNKTGNGTSNYGWSGKTQPKEDVIDAARVASLAGYIPDEPRRGLSQQITLFDQYRGKSEGSKIIQTSSEGLMQVGGMYDPINDIYFMDDNTVIYALGAGYDHQTEERYIYAAGDFSK